MLFPSLLMCFFAVFIFTRNLQNYFAQFLPHLLCNSASHPSFSCIFLHSSLPIHLFFPLFHPFTIDFSSVLLCCSVSLLLATMTSSYASLTQTFNNIGFLKPIGDKFDIG